MIHAEGSTVGSVIHQQVSRRRAQQPADGWKHNQDQRLEGRKEALCVPDPEETQHLLDLLSRRGNATMYHLLTQRQSRA